MMVATEEEDSLLVEVDILEVVMDAQENMIPIDLMVGVMAMNLEAEVVEEGPQEDPEELPGLEEVIDIQMRTGMVEVKGQKEDTVTGLNDMKEEADMRKDTKKKNKKVLMIVTLEVVREENEELGMKKSMKNLEKGDLPSVVEVLGEAIIHVAEEILEGLMDDLNVEVHVVDLVVEVASAEVVEIEVVSAEEEATEEDILVNDMKELPGKATETGMVPVNDGVVVKTDMEVVNVSRDIEMKMEVVIVEEELVVVALHLEGEDADVADFPAEEDPLAEVVDDLSVKTIKTKLFLLVNRVIMSMFEWRSTQDNFKIEERHYITINTKDKLHGTTKLKDI